jgi:hypothetical protein
MRKSIVDTILEVKLNYNVINYFVLKWLYENSKLNQMDQTSSFWETNIAKCSGRTGKNNLSRPQIFLIYKLNKNIILHIKV